MREVKEWKLLVHFHRSRVQLLPEELEGFQEPWCKKNILNNIWETTTCLIFCKPFKKANGLLLFLDPFPTRPLLLFPLHATFPPSDLLKQMISHCAQANDINDIWATCLSKWYHIVMISHCAQPNYINDIWAQANDIKSGHNYFSITTLPTSINSKLAS